MKKKDLYALACIFWFAGCSSPASDEIEIVQNLFPVQFSVQLQKEVLPFSPTRSMPPNTVPEPVVPGEDNPEKELKELCSAIEYLVYKDGDQLQLVKHRTYHVDTEPDFGIVYDTLPAGNYQVYLLAHQSKLATFSKDVFSFDEPSDSFYKNQALHLKEGEETNVDISLQRIVSRIEFKAADKIPEDIARFELTVSHYPNQLEILTGKGDISSVTNNFSYEFRTEEKGQSGKIHSFYSFIPATDEKISVTLTSIGPDNQIMRKRTVTGITPIANKIIRYTGILYTPPKPDETENTFNLIIGNNGKWDELENNELPE